MDRIPEIQIDDARKKLDRECLFVDIRDPDSYRAARIPGAVHLHDGNVQEFIEGADKDRELLFTATTATAAWRSPPTFWKTDSKASRA